MKTVLASLLIFFGTFAMGSPKPSSYTLERAAEEGNVSLFKDLFKNVTTYPGCIYKLETFRDRICSKHRKITPEYQHSYNMTKSDFYSSIIVAARHANWEIVDLLIENGVDPNNGDNKNIDKVYEYTRLTSSIGPKDKLRLGFIGAIVLSKDNQALKKYLSNKKYYQEVCKFDLCDPYYAASITKNDEAFDILIDNSYPIRDSSNFNEHSLNYLKLAVNSCSTDDEGKKISVKGESRQVPCELSYGLKYYETELIKAHDQLTDDPSKLMEYLDFLFSHDLSTMDSVLHSISIGTFFNTKTLDKILDTYEVDLNENYNNLRRFANNFSRSSHLEILVKHGLDLNQLGIDSNSRRLSWSTKTQNQNIKEGSRTLLMEAAITCEDEHIATMVDLGANIELTNENGYKALDYIPESNLKISSSSDFSDNCIRARALLGEE